MVIVDPLELEAAEMVGATVVLAYEHPDSLPILAGAIGRLRREHPHLLRRPVVKRLRRVHCNTDRLARA